MSEPARVLVAGASGYAGALAAQIVWDHPRLELAAVTARSDAGRRLDSVYPRYRVPLVLEELDLERLDDVDAAIVAYPHGAAAPVVAEMRGRGIAVVDLSADFRLLELPVYERWYGPHASPELLGEAAYGLTELHREEVRGASLVANPGCYPTAALLALAPLAAAGLIEDVVIDAKSGVSGAGRGGGEEMSLAALTENHRPYKVEGHRHQPEIEQELLRAAAAPAAAAPPPLTFVPHLLPIDQGELASCYVRPARTISAEALRGLYEERYAAERFVRVVEAPPGVRDVRDTNDCHVHAVAAGQRILVFAALDNLWKGAAGQAVQNLNLMLGLPEEEGLP